MSNIMINEVCNLSCPYCFANNYVNCDDSTSISKENFTEIVKFILNDGPKRIGFIGGEPTLHNEFGELLRIAHEELEKSRKQHNSKAGHIMIFTNGLLLDKWILKLAKYDSRLLLNLNSPEDIGKEKYNIICENIEKSRLAGLDVSIGINFYKPDLDTAFVEEILKKYAFKDLRIGLPAPNTDELRKNGSVSNLLHIKKAVIDFIKRLDESAPMAKPHFDCQKFPSCILTPEEYSYLEGKNECLVEAANCSPVLDFLQDKTVVRCFGCSGRSLAVSMDKFDNYEDINRYFITTFDNLGKLIPTSVPCKGCYARKIGKCSSGCLSYKLPAISNNLQYLNKTFGTEI